MLNKKLLPSLFWLLRIQCWLFVGVFISSAQAVSEDWCLRVLQQNASNEKRYSARPIGLKLLNKVFPLAEKYRSTLEKFEGFYTNRSGLVINNSITWGIFAKYQNGRVTLQFDVDGRQQTRVRVALEILGNDDALQHEMYFLMGSTLSEAKAILGIAESDILQVSVPLAQKHLPRDVTKPTFWSASFPLDRVAPTYGTLPPYLEEAELRLKFMELLIKKLEGDQYSASALWKPDGLKNEIVSVGLNRVYLREVPSARSTYRRVVLEFGREFMYQFDTQRSHFPHLPPATLRGDYKVFLLELLNDLDFFGVELAPTFLDSQGQVVNLNAGRSQMYLDVVANKGSQPVVWVRKILEGALKQYAKVPL